MRRERGITTIGLVVTIIVMLILAGVTISLMQGNSGIISKADESKSQTERKEVIEKAKMTISEKVVNNGGNELTRSELKEILEQYFINVPEDYTLETILKTKEENGKYEIKVSEIYDRDIMTENEETDGSTEVVPPTSSTNVENGNSGNTGTGGNTENNGDTGSSTGGTGNTNSESTSGGNSNNTGNSGNNSTEIDVTKVEMDKQTATVDINGENTVQLNAKVIPSNANKNTEITWTSKKKAVASVNQKGLVTGKTVGNSMIMATSQNGYSADCLVVCQAKITGIKINPVTANMIVGQKITLTATTSPEIVTEKVTWKSRNENVAKVDNNGNVTGIGKGVVEIIAQNPGGTIQAVCTVTVKINPTEIRLNYSKLVLDKNSSNIPKLEATILPETTYVNDSIAWDSSNKNIVTVENGNLTLTGNGEAQITAKTENGLTATCDVTVQTSITSIAVSSTSKKMEVNQTAQLTATVTPADATEKVQWTSSNTDVATVNDTGLVTAKTSGTVTITVKNANGTKLVTCVVDVIDGYLLGRGYENTNGGGAGYITKIDSNGKKIWEKLMAISSDRSNFADGNGAVYAITPTSDGGYLLGRGYENTNGGGTGYITKIDSNGKKIWEKLMAISSDRSNFADGNGAVYAITPTSDGGYLLGRGYENTNGGGTGYITKIDSNGKKIWEKLMAISSDRSNFADGNGAVYAITPTSDGGYLLGRGYENTNGGGTGYITKIDSNGKKIWEKLMAISSDRSNFADGNGAVYAITPTSDGGYLLGRGYENTNGGGTGYITKIDSNGKKIWEKLMAISSDRSNFADGNGAVYAITPTSDGGYLLGRGYENTNGGGTGYITKIDSNGKKIWEKLMAISSDRSNFADGNGAVYAITPTSDGGYLLGRGYENTNGGGTGYITKIDSNGKKIWEKLMAISSDRSNFADNHGAVYAICESK